MWYPLFQAKKLGWIPSPKSPNLELFSERTASIAEREIKGPG
jgi:hypothetical protein